jgi:hypothetical protein
MISLFVAEVPNTSVFALTVSLRLTGRDTLFWRTEVYDRKGVLLGQQAVSRAKRAKKIVLDLVSLVNQNCCKQWDHFFG